LKLKQAREEADKEIAKYRQQREKQFLKYKFVAVEFIHNVYPLASEEDHGTCCSDTLLTQ
jgi:hypothetical protein